MFGKPTMQRAPVYKLYPYYLQWLATVCGQQKYTTYLVSTVHVIRVLISCMPLVANDKTSFPLAEGKYGVVGMADDARNSTHVPHSGNIAAYLPLIVR